MYKPQEEYLLEEVEDYLRNNITLLIVGPQKDERTNAVLERINNIDYVCIEYVHKDCKFRLVPSKDQRFPLQCQMVDLDFQLRKLKTFNYDFKNILMDITSLQTPTISALCRSFFQLGNCKPAKLFIAYAKPQKYKVFDNKYMFSSGFGDAASIPGFVARAKQNESLIPFLGFEGARLRNIISDTQYAKVIPIIGCPSDDPKWQFETMRNCMEVILEQNAEGYIEKCKANSFFEAIYLLDKTIAQSSEYFVLAPLGTKPHSLAAIVFTIKHKSNCRLIYDFAVENYEQSEGIQSILVSHLSSFL